MSSSTSAEPASDSSNEPWLWIVLVVVVAAGAIGLTWLLRSRSAERAAGVAAARDSALRAYTEATAAHDQASTLALAAEDDRLRLLDEASGAIDRAQASFASLSGDPSLQAAAAQIDEVRLALTNLHGALQAASTSGVLDADVLRERLADVDAGLRRFREAVGTEPA